MTPWRAEEAVRRHEAATEEYLSFLARAQRVSSIGTWRSGPGDDAALHWSAETYRIVGLDEREPIPRVADFLALVHPDDAPLVREALTRVAAGSARARR